MARFVALLVLAAIVCCAYAFPKHEISRNCGPNEEFKYCGTPCEPTCQQPEPRPCVFMCKIGCQCKEGFLRTHPKGDCVPRPQCLLRN